MVIWYEEFTFLNNIEVPNLNPVKEDKIVWIDNMEQGNNFACGMYIMICWIKLWKSIGVLLFGLLYLMDGYSREVDN